MKRLLALSLIVSLAALGVSGYALKTRTGERHRCAWVDSHAVSCLSGDTPDRWKEHSCYPAQGRPGLTVWYCRKP